MLIAAKSIMKLIPVTRSGLTIGRRDIFSTTALGRFFMECMPIAAKVPMKVATSADITATERVTMRAFIMVESCISASYHLKEKPAHRAMDLLPLKENTISTRMGAYRNISISPR